MLYLIERGWNYKLLSFSTFQLPNYGYLTLHIYKYLERAFLLPKISNNLLEGKNVLLRVWPF